MIYLFIIIIIILFHYFVNAPFTFLFTLPVSCKVFSQAIQNNLIKSYFLGNVKLSIPANQVCLRLVFKCAKVCWIRKKNVEYEDHTEYCLYIARQKSNNYQRNLIPFQQEIQSVFSPSSLVVCVCVNRQI